VISQVPHKNEGPDLTVRAFVRGEQVVLGTAALVAQNSSSQGFGGDGRAPSLGPSVGGVVTNDEPVFGRDAGRMIVANAAVEPSNRRLPTTMQAQSRT
jgi:hypothetical protein